MEQVMLDMIPTGAKAVCHVSQYDIGRTIRFNLRSGGAAYTLSGTETVKVYIKKPDGTTAERNIANTSSTYVDWVTGEGDCDQAGECECELVITSGTTVIGSKNFTVKVEEDPYNEQGVVTETAGPAVIATFTTNVVDLLQEIKCSINPIQNGTPWIDSNEINKEPYIKRAVAGTATRIGNHLYDKLVGGTVAFNQLVRNGNFADSTSWQVYNASKTTMSIENNVLTLTVIEEGSGYMMGARQSNLGARTVLNHVYIISLDCKPEIAGNYGVDFDGTSSGKVKSLTANSWQKVEIVYKSSNGNQPSLVLQPSNNTVVTVGSTMQWKNVYIIDLTAMFGSTIADYIYSLEQATAGAGVAWFKALFPNDYYAYNEGELMSVKATAHVMKNASNTVIGNYPLDSNLELRGIPKLVNNKLEYDGDIYESNGSVTRKYGIVDLGSVNWTYDSSSEIFTCVQIIGNRNGTPFISPKYTDMGVISVRQLVNMSGTLRANALYLKNTSYTDVETFKTAMSGVYMVYEKATPTTEQASPFTNPQVCNENGTEEYTDSRAVAIPVGHETYQANICEITGFDELNIKQSGQDTSEIAKLIKLEFDDTVYLAEVSCLNGVWKLKLLGAEVDLGNLTPVKYTVTEGNLFRYGLEDIKMVATNYDVTQALCSHYPSVAYSSRANNTMSQAATLHRIDIIDNRYSDATAFKNAMSGVKLVYPLETPTEITLDETEQFEALLGVNNVWHDGNGNTEVKYLYNA